MPTLNLPLSKGLAQNPEEYDWIDSLPINLLSINKPVLGSKSYMHSWPGLEADVVGTETNAIMPMDRSRNGIYDTETNSAFRINGNQLQEYTVDKDGVVTVTSRIKSIAGLPDEDFSFVPMDYSINTVAYIAQGINSENQMPFNDTIFLVENKAVNGVTTQVQITNWDHGQKAIGRNDVYTVNFSNNRYATIPTLDATTNGYKITFELGITEFSASKRYILGNTTASSQQGVFIENNMLRLQVDDKTPPTIQDIKPILLNELNACSFKTQYATGTNLYTVEFAGNTTVVENQRLLYSSTRKYYISFDLFAATKIDDSVNLVSFGTVLPPLQATRNIYIGSVIQLEGLNILYNGRRVQRISLNRSQHIGVLTDRNAGPLLPLMIGGGLVFLNTVSFVGEIRNVEVRYDGASGELLTSYSMTQESEQLPTNTTIISNVTGRTATISNVQERIYWTQTEFTKNIITTRFNLIGAQQNSSGITNNFVGELRNLTFTRNETTGSMTPERQYHLFRLISFGDDRPNDPLLDDIELGNHDGSIVDHNADQNNLWIISLYKATGLLSSNLPATTTPLNNIIDIVRNQARYAFIREEDRNFYITDLDDERKIEYYAPVYDGNSHYGTPVAVESWRNHVVIISQHNTTFYQLTGRGGSATQPIYQLDSSLTSQCGAIHRGAVCRYRDHFAVVGSPVNEPVSVYLITNGSYQEIASRFVQQILRRKNEAKLKQIYIEPFKFDSHDGFILHLDDRTLLFDPSFKDLEWKELISNEDGTEQYRAMYHVFEENRNVWTAGDRLTPTTNILNFTIASHRDTPVLHQVDTPMIQERNVTLHDFEIDNVSNNVSGLQSGIQSVNLSATYDGQNFLPAKSFTLDDSIDNNRRILVRNLGYSRDNIGFRLSWVTSIPASISDFRIRVEQ